jgi:hypothetical protein
MSQRVLDYAPENFPICGILGELTETVAEKGLTPVAAYTVFEHELAKHGLVHARLDYGSTSITTGGHARVPDLRQTIDLEGHAIDKPQMGKIIEGNTRTAREIIRLLESVGDVQAKDVVLSPDLGNTGWDQVEYMVFWSLINLGPNTDELASGPQGFSTFEESIHRRLALSGVDTDLMGDTSADREVRRPEFRRFARAFARIPTLIDINWQNIHRSLSLVDTHISLGSDSESVLAEAAGIPRLQVVATAPTTVDKAVADHPILGEDLRVIQAHGGEVVVAAAGSTLRLERV